MIDNFIFSSYAQASISPSPVNIMMAEMAATFRPGVDINLGAGYVNERTIPKEIIQSSLEKVLTNSKKYKHSLNYGGSKGTENLIESIKNFYLQYRVGNLSQTEMEAIEIVIGTNGATSILEAIGQIFKPGIVITADPVYYIYADFLQRMGFQLLSVAEDEEGLNTGILREKLKALGDLKKKISFFYIVTVNNPTTTILSSMRRREIVEISNELEKELKRPVPVFFDKAYEEIVHNRDLEKQDSGLKFNENGNVFEIGTLSKILAPAFRIGYLLGKRSTFLSILLQRNNDIGFSASVINQEVASYIMDHHIAHQLEKVNLEYSSKSNQIKSAIYNYLGEHLESCQGGNASFYFYLSFKDMVTAPTSPFYEFLSRSGKSLDLQEKPPVTIYLPGIYCVDPKGDLLEKAKMQLRLSYGFEETEQVINGIKYMAEAISFSKN